MATSPVSARVRRVRDVSRRNEVPAHADLIELSKGEPDLDTPRPVVEAMTGAIAAGWTHYATVKGDPELREALVTDANRRHGTSYSAADCVITHGGAAAITATVLALVDHGDRVVTADPSYSLYRDAVALAGGELVEVEIRPGDESAGLRRLAQRAIAEDATMIMLCNPVNPSGATYDRTELESLAATLTGTSIRVFVDEAYEAYVYEDGAFATALDVPSLIERLIFCQTFSKTYAMTGWRIGYVVSSDAQALQAILDVHKTFNGPLNTAVQRAAIEAIRTRDDVIPAMLAEYAQRRAYVMDRLSAVPGVRFVAPVGAFYVFFEYDLDIGSAELRDLLVREHGIALRPGSEFGDAGEHHLRLSYTYSMDTLAAGIDRLEKAFTELAGMRAVTAP
ncbi:aspartate aminotransferase [Brooklawnia cerclae]|uniref:Aspartate aminotransferase n=2 Tax=Brooklawnia cerclae TaxID=349934 RepID=A0ABX0SJX2_9ACTN|nr:aspartate aminotransferase [Brooklawnia cerclae]